MPNEMKRAAGKSLAIKFLSIASPRIAAILEAKDSLRGIADILLCDKLISFIEKQDSDFEDWLKISCNFHVDSDNFNQTVKQLIYVINSINDDNKLLMYANLMRAYKLNLIDKHCFLRLSNILTLVYYGDLLFLSDKKNWYIIEDTSKNNLPLEANNLLNHGLYRDITIGRVFYNGRWCIITELGLDMIRCGFDFENYDIYKGDYDKCLEQFREHQQE